MKKVAIVGFGRFGRLLAELAKDDFEVAVVESDESKHKEIKSLGYKLLKLNQLDKIDFIFLAVPISAFEATTKDLSNKLTPEQIVIDLCSVKVYPVKMMEKYLKNCQILASHPMFGPDSAKSGLAGLQVAFCPITIKDDNLKIINDFWTKRGVEVIETTPEAHDHDSVYSQAFTYTIAKIILEMKLPEITFTTRSHQAIKKVARLSAKDSEQLFHDMLVYNPYFSNMKHKLKSSLQHTNQILDELEEENTYLHGIRSDDG